MQEVIRGDSLEDLGRLFDEGVQLVTAFVPAPPEVVTYLSARVRGQTRAEIEVTEDDELDPRAQRIFDFGDDPARDPWLGYLGRLAGVVSTLSGSAELGCRLLAAEAPHCPRYHVDRVPCRAVLTVLGPATEYLPSAAVHRERLGHGAGGEPDERSGLVAPGVLPIRLRPGELCVFKGESWPGNAGRALVHRSPPTPGVPRILLTLDPLA